MKKFLALFVSVTLFFISGCSNSIIEKKTITEIEFSKNNVFLLTQEFLAEQNADGVKIYKVSNRNETCTVYDKLKGIYEIADFKDNLLLLQSKDSLVIYDIDSKQKYDIYNDIFISETSDDYFKYQAFFANNTDNLVIKKIQYIEDEPIYIGDVSVGYQISSETGLFIYDLVLNKPKFKKKITLKDLELEFTENEEVNITSADIGDGYISLIVKVNPATIPFYKEIYYKVGISDSLINKIGESSLSQSLDVTTQYSYLNNRLIKAWQNSVICVDFISGKMHKFELENIGTVNGVDILDVPGKNCFFVNLGTSSGDLLYKYKIVEDVLNCEEGNAEMLTTVATLQNSFIRGNKLYFPTDEEARKHGSLFVNGTTYRSYSEKGYLCDDDGKTVVIFE